MRSLSRRPFPPCGLLSMPLVSFREAYFLYVPLVYDVPFSSLRT